MRERLDCAILAPGREDWAGALRGPHLGGRLVLHTPQQPHGAAADALADPSMARGRYDAGLLYVDESSIRDWRTALTALAGRPPAVLLVYAVGLRAQAVRDLMALGVADFVRPPFCPEELRARLDHALNRLAPACISEHVPLYGAGLSGPGGVPASPHARALPAGAPEPPVTESEIAFCNTILDRSGNELEAYAVAVAMQRATSRESFRAAKCQVVARFERAYIRAALGRHAGNITLAARMAQKHRRAFWALMRKHDIDPSPYRRTPASGAE
ncbi:helix-turn-helix domain-containing protein [Castellaniella denitrificans]|jgi:DNA-binding response OmpR family regulator|uniref:helix-turn-helix domain-containing protein n=1 Tax=Castellaniella denitrificans TaxID=56119 RepID=UPI0036219337